MSTFELINGSNRPSACEAPETPVVTIGSLAILLLVTMTMTHELEVIDARYQILCNCLID